MFFLGTKFVLVIILHQLVWLEKLFWQKASGFWDLACAMNYSYSCTNHVVGGELRGMYFLVIFKMGSVLTNSVDLVFEVVFIQLWAQRVRRLEAGQHEPFSLLHELFH